MKHQKLFNYMSNVHGIELLETDMQEIENIVLENQFSECTHENTELQAIRCCVCQDCGNIIETDV